MSINNVKFLIFEEFIHKLLNYKFNTFEYFDKIETGYNYDDLTFKHTFLIYNTVYINDKRFINKAYCYDMFIQYDNNISYYENHPDVYENQKKIQLYQIKCIMNTLKLINSLEYLYINTNASQYFDKYFQYYINKQYIFELLKNNNKLTKIKINYNDLQNNDLIKLINLLKNNNSVITLDISCNNITDINYLYELIINQKTIKKIIINKGTLLNRINNYSVINKINIYFKENKYDKEIRLIKDKLIIF